MKTTKLSLAALVAMSVIATGAQAADSLEGAFKEAKVNGKVRFNYFNWQWDEMDDYTKKTSATGSDKTDVNKDSSIAAVGGSIGIKTAPYHNVSLQAEFFTSQPLSALSKNAEFAKSGADLDLRDAFNTTKNYNAQTTADLELESINVLGIANVQYQLNKTLITLGRQYFDTPMTSTNDSKMVPNTFNGYTAVSKDIADTTVTLGYIREMKPRNQDQFVGLLDNDSDTNNALRTSGNTTTVTATLSANKPDYLGVVGVVNKSIKNLELQGWFYKLDGIINGIILEANYKMPVGAVNVTLGGRYFKQIDRLGGKLGTKDVASFDGKATATTGGYTNPYSLDSSMYALRAIAEYSATKFQLGYSQVADEADLLAPWRGFPTGGYTRPMKIENWDANIKSWMVSAWYDFEKAGLVKGLDFNINYLVDDRDEKKIQPKGDMTTITADLNYKFSKALSGRLRMGLHDDKGNARYIAGDGGAGTAGTYKGWDFNEYRAELIYKF